MVSVGCESGFMCLVQRALRKARRITGRVEKRVRMWGKFTMKSAVDVSSVQQYLALVLFLPCGEVHSRPQSCLITSTCTKSI